MQRRLRVILFLLITSALLWSSAAGASSTHAADPKPATTAILSGGSYRLTTVTWQAPLVAQGERYALLAPAPSPDTADLQGSGCCCIYLPCVRR